MTRADFAAVPIDDAARDGRYQLVTRETNGAVGPFALTRLREHEWHLAVGKLDFEPTHYRPREEAGT